MKAAKLHNYYHKETDPMPPKLSWLLFLGSRFALSIRHQRYIYLLLAFWFVSTLFLVLPAFIFVDDFSEKILHDRMDKIRISATLVSEVMDSYIKRDKLLGVPKEDTNKKVLALLAELRYGVDAPLWVVNSDSEILYHSTPGLLNLNLKDVATFINPPYSEIREAITTIKDQGEFITYTLINREVEPLLQKKTPKIAYIVPLRYLNLVVGVSFRSDEVQDIKETNRVLLVLLFFIYALLSIAYTNYLIVFTKRRTVHTLLDD